MKKLRVVTVVGTRPEIIRLSRVLAKLDQYCDHILVHTGQNYDYELNEIFFEDLGFRYMGPVDGHDIDELVESLQKIKGFKGPVLLHAVTCKGKGYNLVVDLPDAQTLLRRQYRAILTCRSSALSGRTG